MYRKKHRTVAYQPGYYIFSSNEQTTIILINYQPYMYIYLIDGLIFTFKAYFSMSRTTTDMDNASHVELNDSIETTFLRNSSIPEPPRYILVIASVFYSITFIAGIISNLSVVVVVVFAKRIRSRMSALFANLGIADMMVILVCMPSAAIDLFAKEVWYLGEFMCKYLRLSVTLVKEIKYVKPPTLV